MDIESLSNGILKNKKQLAKWSRKNEVTCFRVYDKDIPEFPIIVDWYDGDVVVWFFKRTIDETHDRERAYCKLVSDQILKTFEINNNQLFVKKRYRQTTQYERMSKEGYVKTVREQGLKFEVNLSDYLDTGLFLDHRNTRAMVKEKSQDKSVLNLFSYTGAFTCYAIAGGASRTTTVDLSTQYTDWTKRNLQLNKFDETDHQVLAQDCLYYLENNKDMFDIIVCDPPTFSNSKKMKDNSFEVERDQVRLLNLCYNKLNKGGIIYFSNNFRKFELEENRILNYFEVKDISSQTIPLDFRNKRIHQCWLMTKR
ncbi:MAG: class I SAM-dependent methyltransferase [Candidatus Margulisbacteria bacterium]|nr:class I SAM-dependent methyltransferase [Candidatus Margulisiibacteriota bacterium]